VVGRDSLGRCLVGQRPLRIFEMLLREHLRDGFAVGFVVEAALLLERQRVLGLEGDERHVETGDGGLV
jgi:hypothetical protein